MKILSILGLILLAGCYSGTYPSMAEMNAQLQGYSAIYQNKQQKYAEEVESIRSTRQALYATLTTEQLERIDSYTSAVWAGDEIKAELAYRQLCEVMPQDDVQELLNQMDRENYLLSEIKASSMVVDIINDRIKEGQRIEARRQEELRNSIQATAQGMNRAIELDLQSQQQPMQVFIPNQNNDNSTYWQEENARREYFESLRPKPIGPSIMSP